MQSQYNMRSPAVKRLMKEAQELREPTEQYHVQPLDDNLFEWHFTIRGPADSEFDGGIYHGRIILPPEYPMKPPSIILLTPNGRFEIFKKICLSISGHHPESWQPSWSIRTALLAIIGFMPTHGAGAIGSLDYTPEERKVLAKKSKEWKCPNCGSIGQILPPVTQASEKTTQEAKELAAQINFQGENNSKDSTTGTDKTSESSNKDTVESGNKPTNVLPSTESNAATTTTTPQTTNSPNAQFPWNLSPGMVPPPFGFPFHMPPTGAPNTMIPRFPLPCYAPQMFPPLPGFSAPNMMPWLPQQPNVLPSIPSVPTISTNANQGSSASSNPTASTTEASVSSISSSTTPSVNVSTSSTTGSTPSTTGSTPSTTATSTPSSSSTNTTDGLRHRRTDNSNVSFQNAEVPPETPTQGQFSLFLIVFLLCAIGLLVFRRLYLAFNWSFPN